RWPRGHRPLAGRAAPAGAGLGGRARRTVAIAAQSAAHHGRSLAPAFPAGRRLAHALPPALAAVPHPALPPTSAARPGGPASSRQVRPSRLVAGQAPGHPWPGAGRAGPAAGSVAVSALDSAAGTPASAG
ncbi:hypothetical protein BGV04_19975, partial [Clostridioides difficile]